MEVYKTRKYIEDIDYINGTLKGIDDLMIALDVDPK